MKHTFINLYTVMSLRLLSDTLQITVSFNCCQFLSFIYYELVLLYAFIYERFLKLQLKSKCLNLIVHLLRYYYNYNIQSICC